MPRWFCKRWVWAAVAGAAVAVGLAGSGTGQEAPLKVGDVIPLNFQGMPPRQVKVLKVERQADGSVHTEVKDTKTGETFTIVDNPSDAPPPAPKAPATKVPTPKATEPAKVPSRPAAPPTSTSPAAIAGQPKAPEKERWPLLNKVFGRDRDTTPPGMTPATTPEPEKRPLLGGRVFGPRKPAGPSMPAGNPSFPNTTPGPRPGATAPPPILPTPPGGLNGGAKPPTPAFVPVTPPTTPPAFPATTPSLPGGTVEPPLVMPPSRPGTPAPPPALPPDLSKPAPPAITIPPATPTPMPVPVSMPPSIPSAPLPMPGGSPGAPVPVPVPVPVPITPPPVPPAPTVPPVGLPPIPVPPNGTSARPMQVVVPAGYLPPQLAFERDVEPYVIALQTMHAPSARITAAKALAGCRHRSTDGVKAVLFQAARLDPCGEVRAACIAHLCDLGYYDPQFLGFIQTACQDPDEAVRDTAKAACAKMIRR